MAGALLAAGPASADSRGFKLHNDSRQNLKLISVNRLDHVVCPTFGGECHYEFYDMAFEGRPADGTVLNPGGVNTWELKYEFRIGHIFGQTNFGARLTYRIEGKDALMEVEIQTTNYANDSACNVIQDRSDTCTAEGLNVTFR
jgi:hypothetical protein